VILAAKKLKLVVNCATGYNNIAVSTCVARGIPVCTAPGDHHRSEILFTHDAYPAAPPPIHASLQHQ